MPFYKPSSIDCDAIRYAAYRESVPKISLGAVILEPGYRHNVNRPYSPEALNIALISDDPHWNDTDLSDYGKWADFRKGIELTADGRGIVDFYIRKRGDSYGDLFGNVTIEIRNGKLSRIYGYGNRNDYFNA